MLPDGFETRRDAAPVNAASFDVATGIKATPSLLDSRLRKKDSNSRSLLRPDRFSCDMGIPQEAKRIVDLPPRFLVKKIV